MTENVLFLLLEYADPVCTGQPPCVAPILVSSNYLMGEYEVLIYFILLRNLHMGLMSVLCVLYMFNMRHYISGEPLY